MNAELLFRILVLLVLLLNVSISAYFRRKAREAGDVIDRREEGAAVLLLRLFFGFTLLALLLLNVFFPEALLWSKIELPLWLRIVGALFAILSVPLIYWTFSSIGRGISETVLTKQDHELVTHGPYKWVRHPLYSSALMMLFAISLTLADWLIFLYALAGLIVFRFVVIPAEERQLVDTFGEDYRQYQHRTGALVPRVL